MQALSTSGHMPELRKLRTAPKIFNGGTTTQTPPWGGTRADGWGGSQQRQRENVFTDTQEFRFSNPVPKKTTLEEKSKIR